MVTPATSTLDFIITKIRHLTASASESALSTADIEQYINNFYENDFPYAIKLDQTRQVYSFFTIPNVDRYPVNANGNQGFRAPVYFAGVQGNFFKNRDQLYNLYPRYPTQFQQSAASTSGTITGIAQPTNPTQITSPNHNLATGAIIQINNVLGMTQLNGNNYTITVINANTFSLNGIDNTAFGAYISGGTWISVSPNFSFTLFGNVPNLFPQNNNGILSTQVVIGGIDINGNPIRIVDDGGASVGSNGLGFNSTVGRLLYIQTNNVGDNVFIDGSGNQQNAIPPYSPLPIPSPPTVLTPQYIGTVNYVTTQMDFTLPVPTAPGTQLNIWAVQYQSGRPYNLLFWNNEFTIRPVPDKVYKIEVESYLTPAQFIASGQSPVLNQWAQYIAYGAAMEILRDRQDMEGVQNLMEGFMRQEGLVLERQGVEEIGQPNITLFNGTQFSVGFGAGLGSYF